MAENTGKKTNKQDAVAKPRPDKLTLDLFRMETQADIEELARRVVLSQLQLGKTLPRIRSDCLWNLHHKKDARDHVKKLLRAVVERAEKLLVEASDAHKDLRKPAAENNEQPEGGDESSFDEEEGNGPG